MSKIEFLCALIVRAQQARVEALSACSDMAASFQYSELATCKRLIAETVKEVLAKVEAR